MMRVLNRKAIRRLAWKSFKANRIRNVFAILAMVLTSVLFTSLFTTAAGVNNSMQQQSMRMSGGYAHGNFKYLTKQQVKQLTHNPGIKEWGANLFLSSLYEGVFSKHRAELRYFDENSAKMFFSYPTTGTLPKHKYDFAADTGLLKLFGVKPKLGEKVKITYPLGNRMVTGTFTLSGYWKPDNLSPASQLALSKEYVTEQLTGYKPQYKGDFTGSWDLNYMFKSSLHIENSLRKIAEASGYQIDDISKDNYLDYGVNWAYTSAQMDHDYTMVYAVIGIAILILITGYLIIYNIFLISVANDIRYYGLLKTIGTTGRQIRRMIRYQAMLLSVIGIPIGMILGYFAGTRITVFIMSTMTVSSIDQKTDPVIFIGAALFSLLTILISIQKPGRKAGKVSPIEAVRYTEGSDTKKRAKNSRHGARIHRMALSNLLRNKIKTIIVLVSLSLSIILLNSVYVFTKGFDLNKYVSKFMISDFNVASSNYFNVMKQFSKKDDVVSEDMIKEINRQKGIQKSGRIYYNLKAALVPYSQEMIKTVYKDVPKKYIKSMFYHLNGKNSNDGYFQLYGMDDFILKKLEVIQGTLDINKFKTGNYIIQVANTDDYDNPEMDTVFYHPGDRVKINYLDKKNDQGEIIKYHNRTYEVMAIVKDKTAWNVQYYSSFAMILPSGNFIRDTGTDTTMSYQFDVNDNNETSMERFLKNYTSTINKDMSYSSKETHIKEFQHYKDMFIIVGNALSLIIGIIGILNYINVILTGIITRKREFSVLKSIGMTGKQLISMLMYEGLIYAVLTIIASAALASVLNVTLLQSFGKSFWFFTTHFTLVPIIIVAPILLIFSLIVPYAAYHATNRQSIVDQLRVLE